MTAPSCTTTRLPSDDALANRDARVDDAVVADPRAGADRHVRIDVVRAPIARAVADR